MRVVGTRDWLLDENSHFSETANSVGQACWHNILLGKHDWSLDEKSPIAHSVYIALIFLKADKNTKNDTGDL